MREHERDFHPEDFIWDDEHAFDYGDPDEYDFDFDFDDDFDDDFEVLEPERKEARHYTFTRKGLAALLSCFMVCSAIFGVGGAFVAHQFFNFTHHQMFGAPPMRFAPMSFDLAEATGSSLSIQEIIDVAADAVVEINTQSTIRREWMGNRIGQHIRQGAGSGVVISTDGFIMTNNHVIENANQIRVTLTNGDTHYARLVGSDPITDIAVIKINAQNLTPVIFGDSDHVVMGDLAVAIGNPLGQLGGTATVGIISALDRQLTIENVSMTLLQTDAAINQGNSGGGLFNQHGEIVGLVVAKSHGLGIEGLGFAIPINQAKTVAMSLIEHGHVTGRPQIGINMVDLTSTEDAIYHDVLPGIYISGVFSENARKAGLMEGDMLYYIENVRVRHFSDVTDVLQQRSVGDVVTITVVRSGRILEVPVVLSEQGGS
ncbi:MAG: trypsin-like peptidase domain-containing protein [Clostridiales bacterium]|nr:trypsin-like peptidase domain-containing protein [Clostridiales bacterium]